MPDWLLIVIGVATPLLAFTGALVGHLLSRRTAKEQSRAAKQAEGLLMIRWSAERISEGGEQAEQAIALLRALGDTDLVDEASQHMIDVALLRALEPLDPSEYDGDEVEGGEHDDVNEA